MTDNALAPVWQLEIGMPGQERCELRFHRLLNQSFRAGSQNFCQGIVNFVWLTERDNAPLGGSGRLDTNPVTPLKSLRHHPLPA